MSFLSAQFHSKNNYLASADMNITLFLVFINKIHQENAIELEFVLISESINSSKSQHMSRHAKAHYK